eukprot:COSAG06_NODE_59668_length_273_cov_0.896552_1_plen_43_part_01
MTPAEVCGAPCLAADVEAKEDLGTPTFTLRVGTHIDDVPDEVP